MRDLKLKNKDGYDSLLAELAALYEPVLQMGEAARNRLQVQAFWEMGRRIVDVLQMEDGQLSARYGKNVVSNLSRDLTARYGKGFGRSNLFYMRQFALEVDASQIVEPLNWTHYRILLSVKDLEKRAEFARLPRFRGIPRVLRSHSFYCVK